MRTLRTILLLHIFACVAVSSPAGTYLLDTFDVGLIDPSLWTTTSPYTAGNCGVYVNINSFSGGGVTSSKALFVIAGGNTGQAGGLITSAAIVQPEIGQQVVLTADRVAYIGGEGHAWGLMIPGGDGRTYGTLNNSDTDYILLKEIGYVAGGSTYYGLKVAMRKAGGAIFYSNEIYAILFNTWYWQKTQIMWSQNRVIVSQGGTIVFDTGINGGSSFIPSVPMNLYVAGGSAYNKLIFESLKLEVADKPLLADINHNGNTDLHDFAILAENWLKSVN